MTDTGTTGVGTGPIASGETASGETAGSETARSERPGAASGGCARRGGRRMVPARVDANGLTWADRMGTLLLRARQTVGMTQMDVEARIPMAQTQLSKIERGAVSPRGETVVSLLALYRHRGWRVGKRDRDELCQIFGLDEDHRGVDGKAGGTW